MRALARHTRPYKPGHVDADVRAALIFHHIPGSLRVVGPRGADPPSATRTGLLTVIPIALCVSSLGRARRLTCARNARAREDMAFTCVGRLQRR